MDARAWYRWFKQRGGRELRQIALQSWDPIGVGDESPTEYDGYLGRIANRLRLGDDVEAIATMLTEFTQDMGLAPDHKRDRRAAEAMRAWYAQAMGGGRAIGPDSTTAH